MFTQTEATQHRIFVTSDRFNIYPNWNAENLENDLATIQLSEPANYGDYIHSVRLPNRRQLELTFAGQEAIVSGWGRSANWNTGKCEEEC